MKKLSLLFLSLVLLISALCLTSCDFGKETEDCPEVYVLTFSYAIPKTDADGRLDTSTYARIEMVCDLGDVVTVPTPEFAGFSYSDWMVGVNGQILVSPGEQITVTKDLFLTEEGNRTYHSPGSYSYDPEIENKTRLNFWDADSDYDGYVVEYYGYSETNQPEVNVYSVNLITRDGSVTIEDVSAHTAHELYSTVQHRLLTELGVSLNWNGTDEVANIFTDDGYAFGGFYLDESCTAPFTASTKITEATDIYTKWDYTGLYFTYAEWGEYYYVSDIRTSERIDVLTIPETCNFIEVKYLECDWQNVSGGIGKLVLPGSIGSVDYATFEGCSGLVDEVVISEGTVIEPDTFSNLGIALSIASGNNRYLLEDGILYDLENNSVASVLGSVAESVIIREGITDIGLGFSGKGIKSIKLPASVTSIADEAFYNCSALESVRAEGKLTYIGDCAFYNCESLDLLIFATEYGATIGSSAFSGTGTIDAIYYIGGESDWSNVEKTYASLEGSIYFYSKYEQTVDNYLYTGEILWHYDDNGEPALWINIKNDLAGKTFVVRDAEVTVSNWYWNMLSTLKQQGLLDQVADEELRDAVNNATTKEELDAALSVINSRAEATIIFGTDGTVTIYNEQDPEGYTYTFVEINNLVILTDPTGVHNLLGEFFIDENGDLYEIQPMPEVNGNETGTIRCNYKESHAD